MLERLQRGSLPSAHANPERSRTGHSSQYQSANATMGSHRLGPLAVFGSLALSALLLWSVSGLAADEDVVLSLTANGSRNTRPFNVKDGWEIRWDNKGPVLAIAVKTVDGKLVAGGGSSTAPGSGQSFQPKGGKYFLDVTGMGDWTITVVQLP